MLLLERIDVFIGDYETTSMQIAEIKRHHPNKYRPIYFDLTKPLSLEPTFIALQHTEQGKELMNIINTAIIKLRAAGKMPKRTH